MRYLFLLILWVIIAVLDCIVGHTIAAAFAGCCVGMYLMQFAEYLFDKNEKRK